MKRIFAKGTLREFWEKHPEVEQQLKVWYEDVLAANWTSPSDVKRRYATASILKNGRIVFNIRGNSFRLVAHFKFEKQLVLSDSSDRMKNTTKLTLIQFNHAEIDQDKGRV